MAARAAVVAGCEVYAADVSPSARELAKEIGCKVVVEDVKELAEYAPELIVDYAGFGVTTAQATEAVAVGEAVGLVLGF